MSVGQRLKPRFKLSETAMLPDCREENDASNFPSLKLPSDISHWIQSRKMLRVFAVGGSGFDSGGCFPRVWTLLDGHGLGATGSVP